MTTSMTDRERFLSVVRFEKPDHWPLINMDGLGFVHSGGLPKLHAEGLPERVNDLESWIAYWGQSTIDLAPNVGRDAPGVKSERRIEDEFEYIRYETGALTRQVVNNETTYSMPEFVAFDVRDRASWKKFRDLKTPRAKADVEEFADRFDHRTRPLRVRGLSTWGHVRSWMGPERALLAIYDDPDLVRDMIEWQTWCFDEFHAPMIERYRPEVITMWEDFCYNHGMMISPKAFRELCAPHYRHVAEVGRDCGVELFIVDSDGMVAEYLDLLEEVGFNGNWPMEQVCGNDILAYRRKHPRMIVAGGIEKEVCNTGHGHRIREELLPKVPEMLEQSGYFPMFDHQLQPGVGFEEHCRAMTVLHETCRSEDLGEFPRR